MKLYQAHLIHSHEAWRLVPKQSVTKIQRQKRETYTFRPRIMFSSLISLTLMSSRHLVKVSHFFNA